MALTHPTHYTRPPCLHSGDLVAYASPSSHQGPLPPAYLQQGADLLRSWGLEVLPFADPEPRHLYLAGQDGRRRAQLLDLWTDPDVKALFLTRGGYGAARMLANLPHQAMAAAAPKIVTGFSDSTALFAYLHKVAGVQCLHAPFVPGPAILGAGADPANAESLRQALFDPAYRPPVALTHLHGPQPTSPLDGPLLGGCLSLLATTLGTPWELDTTGAVLLVEDIGEPIYKLDRMLTHLKTAGKLQHIQALIIGNLHNCPEATPGLLDAMLNDLFAHAPYPVYRAEGVGHGERNVALWLGTPNTLQPAP